MAGKDAGVEALCPGCGQSVLQKAMIPVLAEGGGVAYLCVACARLHIHTEPVAKPEAETEAAVDEATDGKEDPAPAETTAAAPTKTRSRRTPRPDRPLRARAPRAADA